MPYLVEDSGKEQKAYQTLLSDNPKVFSALSSELALKIINFLSFQPACAMDIARRLKQHEQKIYYHMKNLERAGIIKLVKTEGRVGALAKIYAVQYPAISVKLFEGESIVDSKTRISKLKFLNSFINEGEFDATIVIGSPDPHGKYGVSSSDGCCAIDLALFIGNLTKNSAIPNYKLDTEMKEEDLEKNLVLIGGPKSNTVVDRFNKKLPIYFDFMREWNIVSPFSKKIYTEDGVGLVVKTKNPFNEKKEILVLAGKRFRGTRAAILSLVKHLKEIERGNRFEPNVVAKVVIGVDRDSDKIIDDVEFLE